VGLGGSDAEERGELLPPLADQALGGDEQHATRALGSELGHHQPRLDGLAQAHLVREDAAAFGEARECEDDRLDLVRVRVDAARALRGRKPALLVRAAAADNLLREPAALDRVEPGHWPEEWRALAPEGMGN
jgi:hypothetical protein